MRKVLLNVAVTLDGFIAGPNGEYDWCFADSDYGMTEFMASVDSILMGRKSFDLVVQYEAPYPEKEVIVFSRTLRKESPFSNVIFVSEDLPSYVDNLLRKEGKNIWLFGGATIIDPLFEKNLIDEMHLSIHPIILGDGIPLFKKGLRRSLELSKSIAYPSGLVQLIYKRI